MDASLHPSFFNIISATVMLVVVTRLETNEEAMVVLMGVAGHGD